MDTNSDVEVGAAALRASAAIRALGHALVAHQSPDPVLNRIAEAAERLRLEVEANPVNTRSLTADAHMFAGPGPEDGVRVDHGTTCPVSGELNPLGLAMVTRRVGDEVLAEVTLGAAAAGSPGMAHGGVVAALLDDIMGFVLSTLERSVGVTARLEIQFRKPVPIGVPLYVRGRLRDRDGRKRYIDAFVEQEGTILAEADALFLVFDALAVPAQ